MTDSRIFGWTRLLLTFLNVPNRKPAGVTGLTTDSTPLPLYRELIKREKEGKIDFSNVRSANLDEYKGLAPDHPQSYRKFKQDNLLDHISIMPENTIVPLGLVEYVQAMCEAYETQIKQWGGVELQLRWYPVKSLWLSPEQIRRIFCKKPSGVLLILRFLHPFCSSILMSF